MLIWNSFGAFAGRTHCRVISLYAKGFCGAWLSANHAPLREQSLRRDQMITRFLHGTQSLRPVSHTRNTAWDLAIVLDGLSIVLFEPIETVQVKFVALKVFLLAITSLRRVAALLVSPTCLKFAPGMVKVFLYPRPGYVTKVLTNVLWPFRDQNQ